LHIFPVKGSFDGQFVGVVLLDQSHGPFKDLPDFNVMILEPAKFYDPQGKQFRFLLPAMDDPVSHYGSSRINPKYDFAFFQ